MFSSGIIQVAIGLIFVYVLLAILVTQINTLISNILKWRAKNLKEGIARLIIDKRLQAEVMIHPLVNMVDKSNLMLLSLQVNNELAEEITSAKPSDVTYIAPQAFADAMMSILISRSAKDLYGPILDALLTLPASDEKNRVLDYLRNLESDLNNENLQALEDAIQALPDNQEALKAYQHTVDTIAKIRTQSVEMLPLINGINTIKVPVLKDALKLMLTTAENIEDARKKIETWFDDGMARTSEAYKSRMQWWAIGIATACVFVLNIDTFYFGRILWEDPALRASVASAAREFTESDLIDVAPEGAVPETDADEPGADGTPADEESPTASELAQQNLEDIAAVEATVQQLLELQLPVGWEHQPVTDEMIDTARALGLQDPRNNARNVWNLLPWNNSGWLLLLLQKLIGLAVSAIAAAQGAPFWFDLLRKLTKPSNN